MIVSEVYGDLISRFKQGHYSAIAHGCNCKKTMGAGIAKVIAKEFPEVEETDLITPEPRPGGMSVCLLSQGIVFNLYTQIYPGPPIEGENRLDLIHSSFQELELWAKMKRYDLSTFTLGIPRIGAGLAGGDWNQIRAAINESSGDVRVEVVLLA